MAPKRDYPKNRRKKYLINKRFQLNFMAYMIGMTMLAILFFYAGKEFFFWKFFHMGKEMGLSPNHISYVFMEQQKALLDILFIYSSLLTFVVLFFVGLRVSNRVAGPLYSLRKHMDEMAEGTLEKEIHFRKKDYFQELAISFNRIYNKFFQNETKRKK